MNQETKHVAALDLGSSKTRAVIAELLPEGDDATGVRFLGFGEVESQGWRKGMIAELEQVTSSVKEAVAQAEAQAGAPLESAVVGVGGPHIQGVSTSCGLTFSARPRVLTREDVRRVMEAARDIPLARDREILHLVPEEFVLDSQETVRDPIAMQSSRLGVRAHIVSGSVIASQNVVAAVNRAGVLVETTVLEAFAAAEVALAEDEKELGALVAVLGGGSSDLVVYGKGSLRMAAAVPIGGDHLTNDVAVGLHTSLRDAEIIKTTFGSVLTAQSKEGSTIEVPGLGDRPARFVATKSLCDILESRAEELLGLILDHLIRCGMDRQLGAGVIFCGGGARLGGLCDLAERVLGVPARLGLPPNIIGMPETLESPEYATLVGLLLYAQRLQRMRSAAQPRTLGSRWKDLIAGTR